MKKSVKGQQDYKGTDEGTVYRHDQEKGRQVKDIVNLINTRGHDEDGNK